MAVKTLTKLAHWFHRYNFTEIIVDTDIENGYRTIVSTAIYTITGELVNLPKYLQHIGLFI